MIPSIARFARFFLIGGIALLTPIIAPPTLQAAGNFPEGVYVSHLQKINNLHTLEIELPFLPNDRQILSLKNLGAPLVYRNLGAYPDNDRELAVYSALETGWMNIRHVQYPEVKDYQWMAKFPGKRGLTIMGRHPDSSDVDELLKGHIDNLVFEWSALPDLYTFTKLKNLPPFHVKCVWD